MRRIRSISVRYRPFTKNTRKETKAVTECVVETRSVMRPSSCTRGEGCSSLLSIKTSDFKVIAYAYLVITIALTNQPALPLIPSVTTAHGEQPIKTLLPFRWRRMDRTLAATVDIPQVLQRCTVRSIVIPYRKLKQQSPEYELNLMRPVFAQMRLIKSPQVSKHIQLQHPLNSHQ